MAFFVNPLAQKMSEVLHTNTSGQTCAHFIGQDAQPGRRLGPYSCRATLLQLFVIGEGIDSHYTISTPESEK
jgi:hypothetical protein